MRADHITLLLPEVYQRAVVPGSPLAALLDVMDAMHAPVEAALGGLPAVFDPQLWGFDREANFEERRRSLIDGAAEALETRRTGARMDLARFYLAREMYPEAKGVLDVAIGDEKPGADDPAGLLMRALASIMLGRVPDALKDLSHPIVVGHPDAQIWRGMAMARQGNWADAYDKFRNAEASVAPLPIQLQRMILKEAVRAGIEVKDVMERLAG